MVKSIAGINEAQWSAEQVAFMQDFCKQTEAIAGKKARLWQGKVEVELSYYNENYLSGDNIQALETASGHGMEAIEWIQGLIDKYRVSMYVDAVPELISTKRWKQILEEKGFARMGGTGMRYTAR